MTTVLYYWKVNALKLDVNNMITGIGSGLKYPEPKC